MNPRRRPQQSLDDRAEYDRQRRTFEGAADIKTQPTTDAYREGWDRIFKIDERAVAAQLAKHGQEYLDMLAARRRSRDSAENAVKRAFKDACERKGRVA